jgi:hypothetical protein
MLWLKRHVAHGGYISERLDDEPRELDCSHCFKRLLVHPAEWWVEELEFDGDSLSEPKCTRRTRLYTSAAPKRRVPKAEVWTRPDDARARILFEGDA